MPESGHRQQPGGHERRDCHGKKERPNVNSGKSAHKGRSGCRKAIFDQPAGAGWKADMHNLRHGGYRVCECRTPCLRENGNMSAMSPQDIAGKPIRSIKYYLLARITLSGAWVERTPFVIGLSRSDGLGAPDGMSRRAACLKSR